MMMTPVMGEDSASLRLFAPIMLFDVLLCPELAYRGKLYPWLPAHSPIDHDSPMPGGRPTKLTPELQSTFIAMIEEGNYVEVAARAAGITDSTYYLWMAEGRKATRGPYREFSDAVKRAEAKAERLRVQRITSAGTGEAAEGAVWQADSWYLERRYPARWGRKDRMQVAGDPNAPLIHEIHVIYEDQPTIPPESDV